MGQRRFGRPRLSYFRSQHSHRPSHRQPTYRSHRKWFYLFGEEASWPLTPPLFPPPHQQSCTPATQRTIRRHGTTGCAKVQRADVPRTCPTRSVPLGRFLELKQEAVGAEEAAGSRVHPPTRAVTAALIARWSAILAHATFTALAASLLCEDTSSHNNVDGFLSPRSEILAHMPREPAPPAEPQPPS